MNLSCNSPDVSQIQNYDHSDIFDQSMDGNSVMSDWDDKTVANIPHESIEVEQVMKWEDASEERQREYRTVKELNKTINTIYKNLDFAGEKLQQFSRTVDQTDQLLDLWIMILSQSEHTKRLVDDIEWDGGNMDLLKIREEQEIREREEQERQAQILELERVKREQAKASALPSSKGKVARGSSTIRGGRGTARGFSIVRGRRV